MRPAHHISAKKESYNWDAIKTVKNKKKKKKYYNYDAISHSDQNKETKIIQKSGGNFFIFFFAIVE